MSDRRTRAVAVIGASGFIGSAVAEALRAEGYDVVAVRAPRLGRVAEEHARARAQDAELVAVLARAIAGCQAVVNAAGDPDASSRDVEVLIAANSSLPGLVGAAAASLESAPRYVHVSSAVVQGRAPVLDDRPASGGYSAYAKSKVIGEDLALSLGPDLTVVYRPPSVHAADRRVTRMTARIASSPLAVVAHPGDQPTPQALVQNVASAICFLATNQEQPPRIVAHPSEGLTTSTLLELLGGRRPRSIPAGPARLLSRAFERAGARIPVVAANARRMEMILFGQGQAPSWMTVAGWGAPAGHDEWRSLGETVRNARPGDGRP